MLKTSISATAEGLNERDPEDMLNEARDMCTLIFMAISSLQLDNEISAISAGVYDLENKLATVANALKARSS